jgi:hypothetical protein
MATMINMFRIYKAPIRWVHVVQCWSDNTADKLLEHFPKVKKVDEYDGRRSTANKFRTFVTRNSDPELAEIFSKFDTAEARAYFTDLTGVDCSQGKLRIELCQDGPGFWLEKHVDIPEKLITLQIYLGKGKHDWGTYLYDAANEFNEIVVPFLHNQGWLTNKNAKVLHGLPEKTVDGIRRSVIINYVVGDWNDTDQLY